MTIRQFNGGIESARNKLNEIVKEVNALARLHGDRFIVVRKGPGGVTASLNIDAVLERVARLSSSGGSMTHDTWRCTVPRIMGGAYWSGISICNITDAQITVTLTATENDGDIANVAINIAAAGTYVNLFSALSWVEDLAPPPGGTFGDDDARIEIVSSAGPESFMAEMQKGGVSTADYTIGRLTYGELI